MTYIVDQLFPPIKFTDEDDDIEYTAFNFWRDPVTDVDDIDMSGHSTPTNTSLKEIQSKPLATIPENWGYEKKLAINITYKWWILPGIRFNI